MVLWSDIPFHFYLDDIKQAPVSGNKIYKLAPNIQFAKQKKYHHIVSFGGPYSNHLHALAWSCKEADISCVGIVRGELQKELTPTLLDCQQWGMQLMPLERGTYRAIQDDLLAVENDCLSQDLTRMHGLNIPRDSLILPEGGSNLMAVNSLAEGYRKIFNRIEYQDITHVVCATGTGATVAGLCKAAPANIRVMGIQVVAEGNATYDRIKAWLCQKELSNLSIIDGHLGGFAKATKELTEFIDQFESKFNIPLDHVYNGKVAFKLSQMAKEGTFTAKDKVLVIHTGGLQGKRHNKN